MSFTRVFKLHGEGWPSEILLQVTTWILRGGFHDVSDYEFLAMCF